MFLHFLKLVNPSSRIGAMQLPASIERKIELKISKRKKISLFHEMLRGRFVEHLSRILAVQESVTK